MVETFNENVLNTAERVLVKFGAPWCGPCKTFAPIIEQIAADGYKVYDVNTDENQDAVVKYGIRSVPTIIVFKNGEPMETFIGVQSKSTLINALEEK